MSKKLAGLLINASATSCFNYGVPFPPVITLPCKNTKIQQREIYFASSSFINCIQTRNNYRPSIFKMSCSKGDKAKLRQLESANLCKQEILYYYYYIDNNRPSIFKISCLCGFQTWNLQILNVVTLRCPPRTTQYNHACLIVSCDVSRAI